MDNRQKIIVGVNIRMIEEKPSGIQNFIYGLLNNLTKNNQNYEFIFFTTGNKKIDDKTSHVKADSFLMRILERIDKRLANVYFDNFYIIRLLKKNKVNIFIAPSSILPIFKPKNLKYIVVIHDLSFLKYPHNPLVIYMNLVFYMKTLIPFVIRRADTIVVDSFFVKKELERVYRANPKKIKVIYLGKDDFFYSQKNKSEFQKITKKYSIEKDFIFSTATNHERKNIFGLISAFKNIKQSSRYQLVICGLLPDFTIEKLKKYLKEENLTKKVKFLGFVSKEELRLLYSFAKIFVFPSFEEGFGLPVLEAVSCGCLPICSDAGALPEVIGEKKLLFNPRNTPSITKKINEVLSWTEEKYLGYLENAKKHISRFGWEKAASQYMELFKC